MYISPTDLYSALSHETRLRCVLLLHPNTELCVCDLTRVINAPQPHLSRHLGQLRELGLVTDRRQGQWIYYRLNPDLPAWVESVVQATVQSVEAVPPFSDDFAAVGTSYDATVEVQCC